MARVGLAESGGTPPDSTGPALLVSLAIAEYDHYFCLTTELLGSTDPTSLVCVVLWLCGVLLGGSWGISWVLSPVVPLDYTGRYYPPAASLLFLVSVDGFECTVQNG